MTDESASRPHSGKERINTRAAGVIGIAVMCSRVLGLIRETVFAALFGGVSKERKPQPRMQQQPAAR